MVDNKVGWSFCIVTAPKNDDILIKCIKKIQQEFIDIENYEILIIGNPKINNSELLKKTKIIPFTEEFFAPSFSWINIKRVIREVSLKRFFFKTGAICHKKNLAAKNSKYDKLCIMHDYVGIEKGWRKGFEEFEDNWDISMNIILNQDNSRHRDWMAWDHPSIADKPDGKGACLIPYDTYTKYMYISGTYFCVKKDFFLNNTLNEKLFWGEGEDVEWSLRVREKTDFKMNIKSTVKYLKLKDIHGAPNCQSWKNNAFKMEEVLYAEKNY